MSIERIDSAEIHTQVVIHGGVAYVCGQTAKDRSADIKGQTAEVLAKLDDRLARAGTDKSKLLMVNIYLADMAQRNQMNEVWQDWLGTAPRPARACVGAPLATADCLIEIVATAAV